jgi:hypothetical protein
MPQLAQRDHCCQHALRRLLSRQVEKSIPMRLFPKASCKKQALDYFLE